MNESSSPLGFVAPEPSELAPLFPGYEIHDLIATGGMGAVYRAVQKSLDRTVALKILPMEFSEDAEFCAGFEAEAKAMARLNHPNLIGVHDFGSVNGMLFIVMEFVPGKSIYHSAYGQAIDPSEVIRLVTGVCNGLAHAHENGILHRDIKPSNILLTSQAEPKIGDFGLARPVEHKTQEGEVVFGTPGYTAPEVMENPDLVDHRADLFSVGVFLHELLTGKLPADDPRPASVIAGCDVRFDAIIRRATDPLPANRYSSAAAIAAELEKITSVPKAVPAAKVAAGPPAGATRPSPPRRTVTVVKSKPSNLKWVGPLIAITIMAFCWYQFLNMKPRVVEIKKPVVETKELKELESVRENVSAAGKSSSLPTPAPPDQQYVYLDDLIETEVKIGWGILGKYGASGDSTGSPLLINGNKPQHSLFSHPPANGSSRVIYSLNRYFSEFSGKTTVADNIHGRSLTFRISGDGKPLWNSKVINSGKDAEEFRVSVLGVSKLELEIECPGDNGWAWGVWVSPKLSTTVIPEAAIKTTGTRAQLDHNLLVSSSCGLLIPGGYGELPKDLKVNFLSENRPFSVYNLLWGESEVFVMHPFSDSKPATLNFSGITGKSSGIIVLKMRDHPNGDCRFEILKSGKVHLGDNLNTDKWKTVEIPFDKEAVALSIHANGWLWEYAFLTYQILPETSAGGSARSSESNRTRPSGIPSDATYFNGKWYRVYDEGQSWKVARDACKSLGGQLVVIPDQETQKFLNTFVAGKTLLIGATDEQNEGIWVWSDGKQMTFKNFAHGQPDNWNSIEQFLVINYRTTSGEWNDWPGYSHAGYICEWPDKPVDLTSAAKPPQSVLPPPTPQKAEATLADLIAASREKALRDFPELKDPNSPLTKKVAELKQQKEQIAPSFFKMSEWPHLLASTVQADLRQETLRRKVSYMLQFPDGARTFNGKRYLVYEDSLTWDRARIRCEKERGRLAVIPDAATQGFIRDLARGRSLWIGATDEKKDGTWVWVDGSRMVYSAFGKRQPNNRDTENYLMVHDDDGWHDAFRESEMGYICEWQDNAARFSRVRLPKQAEPLNYTPECRLLDNTVDGLKREQRGQLGWSISENFVYLFGELTFRAFKGGLLFASKDGKSQVILLKDDAPRAAPIGHIAGDYQRNDRVKTLGYPLEGEFSLFDGRYQLHVFDKGVTVWRRSDSRMESSTEFAEAFHQPYAGP